MSNGTGGMDLSPQTVIAWVVRVLVGIFVAVLAWNVNRVVDRIDQIETAGWARDQKIITLQVERRSDADKLDDIEAKVEAIRQMLITGEVRVIPRESR